MNFIKAIIAKIKGLLQEKAVNAVIKNTTPIRGKVIHLEMRSKEKFYKIVVKDDSNKTVVLKVKKSVRVRKGDWIKGHYSKDHFANIEVA